MDGNSEEEKMEKDQLLQHVHNLEQTAKELQQKVVTLQQDKEKLEIKLKHHGSLEQREQMEVMEAKVEANGEEGSPRHRAGSFDSNYSSREISNASLEYSGDANLSFNSNSDHGGGFSDSCLDIETLSRETDTTLNHIFDSQKMSSADLTQLKHHLTLLSQEVFKMHTEIVSLKNELHNSSIRQEELEQDENKVVEIMAICKSLQDQVNQLDVTEKQLREKLKLTENTSAELEQSETHLRERTDKAEEKEIIAKKQAHEYWTKIEELKEIILDKDMVESKLSEKVSILEKAEMLSSDKISELESRNLELKQRLVLKEEMEADNTYDKSLNDTLDELQSENDSLTMRCSELEENEEILRNNWEKSAQEHANRIHSLEDKIRSLESCNLDLKSKLEEDSAADTHRPSLAIELSEVDKSDSEDDTKINQTVEFLLHRINNLESTLSSLEEAKNTKIECLQEQIAKLKENEIILSETISEMEREERTLKSQLKLNQKGRANNEVVQYEGKIHELHRSQENLLMQLDSMEDHESDLKQRLKDTEDKYELKIEKLEIEIAKYIEQEHHFSEKISELEKSETELMEKLETADEENQQLAEENQQLIDKCNQIEQELETRLNETVGNAGQTGDIDQMEKEINELKDEKCKVEEMLQRTESELQQVQLENDDLNERLIELDSSEQECLEKIHKFEHQAAEVSHLRKKVEVLEDAEMKLMDRVNELEEVEQSLKENLNKNNKDVSLSVLDQQTDTSDLSNNNIPSSLTENKIPPNDGCVKEFHVKSLDLALESKSDHLCCDKHTDTIDLMDVKTDGSASPGKVTGLFERLQHLENENASLTEKLSSLTATDKQVRQLSDKIKMLEVAEDKLMERVMELEEIEDRLRGELRRAKSAENRLGEVEQELSEVESKVESLELENNTLRKELHSSGSSEFHSEVDVMKILDLEHAKADLMKERDGLFTNLTEGKAKLFKAETDLKELQTTFNELQNQFHESETSEKDLKDELNVLEKEKEKLLDNVDELEHKLQTSEEDIDQFDVLKNKLEEKIQRLEDELAQVEESEFELKKDNIEVHKQNEKLNKLNKDLEHKLEDTKKTLTEVDNAKTETELKLANSEQSNADLESKLENVQKSKDEIEKTIKDAVESKDTAERKMTFAVISKEQMEAKVKDMDKLYEEVQANLENSKKTILSLKIKITNAEKANMKLQINVEKANKAKTDAEKQLEIVRKSNSYLQSKVMKGSTSRLSPDNNQNSVESIHSGTCMTCGSNLGLPKQLSTFQGGLEDLIHNYRDHLQLDTSTSPDSVLPSHLMTLDEPFQNILKDFISCKACILNRISGLQEDEKSLRDANKLLENHYISEIEDLNKTVSAVGEQNNSLQEQVSNLEEKSKKLCQNVEGNLSRDINSVESSSQTSTSETEKINSDKELITMTGEIDKPEDILRQRIKELEKLEKHLKKQVSDLESDRDELHEIARKDKNLIHEQNVRIRELQLAEKMLKEQASKYEISENNLYKKVEEHENKISKMEDKIQELEILEMRLKELVRKYKLDEEVWLSKSENLETSVSELTVSEYNLKKQLENVVKEKMTYSEKSDYLALRLKELENAEANLVQRMKEQENKEKTLNERLAVLQSSGSNTEAQAAELHSANIVLTQQLNQAIQENAGLVHQTSQMQSQLIMLDQQCVSIQEAYSQLKEEKHGLEKSQKDLESKVKEKRLSGVDVEEKVHRLEENEKTLKEKISTLQRSENRLKYKVQQMESLDSQDLTEMSENKIPHKLKECQQRLVMLRKQNQNLKSRLLEYQNLASVKSLVKLPQKEYKQMEARVVQLEHTEAQLHNIQQSNVQLQQKIDQQLQGKQVPETEEEINLLKERLKQNEVHLQIFRQLATDGQWDEILPVLNSVNLIKGHQTVERFGQPTEGHLGMKTVTSGTGQPLEELAIQMVSTGLETGQFLDDQSDTSTIEDFMTRTKRGTDQIKPTADDKRKLINDLISHLDKDSDDLDSSVEEIHWKKVESLIPVKSQDRKWITVGQATSLHSSRPGDSRNKEEELVLGLNLPSESEGLTQNGTDSNTSSPVLKRRKFLSADSTHPGPHHVMPPSTASKTPDSLDYYLQSSEQNSGVDMHGFVEEIRSHAAPSYHSAPKSSSLHDSGHFTASTVRGTSLRERIIEIGRNLEKKSAPESEMTDEDESLFTWKTKAFEAKRNFENAEKEVKHSKDEINKLEKELAEKSRYIKVLESFVDVLETLLCNKENRSDREILTEMELELQQLKESLAQHTSQDTGSDITSELHKKDRELAAKRNEVDSLMQELRQWQQECRTIEDMRVNALESLRCLEQEISDTQTSEKHLKEDYNHLYEQISSLEKNKEDLSKTIASLKVRINQLSQKCKEKNSLLCRLKDEFSQGSGKSSALFEELKVMESHIDKEDNDSVLMLSNGNPPDQRDRHLISEQFLVGEIPKNPYYTAVSDYDPTLFSKSSRPRLEVPLTKGDNVLITGPLDDKGYFEAEVNGKIGLVPSAYLGRQPLNGHHHSSPRDRRWQQYEKPPNHLNTSPENIVQMYGQLVKQGKPGYSSPKFNEHRKTDIKQKQVIPDPPQDFEAVETERGITLSWTPPETPVTGYKIFVDGKLHRHLTKPNITRLVLHSISSERDHIFGIESVCDRQVSEIIDIFYGDMDSREEKILSSQEFIKMPQRQYLGIYDYNPKKQSPRSDTSQELAFNAGDSITIYGEERKDGYYYGCVDGLYGLVPSYFVEEIPKSHRQKYNIESNKYNTR